MPKATHREIEIKLRVADPPLILRQLRKVARFCRERVLEQNTLYDTPEKAFFGCGRLLRVRLETPAPHGRPLKRRLAQAVLTAKAPPDGGPEKKGRSRYKVRLERELPIEDLGGFVRQIRSLGLRPAFQYEKYRTTFELPGLHLAYDETPAGNFLELEGTPRAIDRAARALGFGTRDYLRITYWDVYVADCRRRGRTPRNMLFRA